MDRAALRKDLTELTAAAGSQGCADCRLAAARCNSRKQEVGKVEADNEQDRAYSRSQHPQAELRAPGDELVQRHQRRLHTFPETRLDDVDLGERLPAEKPVQADDGGIVYCPYAGTTPPAERERTRHPQLCKWAERSRTITGN